jgi:hypothetical protein
MRIRTRQLDKLGIKLYNWVQLIEVSDREPPLKLLFIDSVVEKGNSWSNVAPLEADHCGLKGLRGFSSYECGAPGKVAFDPGCPF